MSRCYQHIVWNIVGMIMPLINRCELWSCRKCNQIAYFDTSLQSDNLGDYIIMRYCEGILKELFGERKKVGIPTHAMPTHEQEKAAMQSSIKVVCGTNLLTSNIERHWNWMLPDGFCRKMNYRNVILLGVGWKNYEEPCSAYSKMIYCGMLNPTMLHSVRDSYTEKMLHQIGIKNVINTGCPTMWRITPELCEKIPCGKADNVITTVTDYRQDVLSDNIMLETLGKHYKTVFLWLQGSTDKDYIKQLKLPDNLQLIEADLDAYEKILRQGDIDYIGTRLHAGIFALNHGVRSLVVAVDNRAVEIAKDTNLPIIHRKNLRTDLARLINEDRKTDIRINRDNIERFLMQFNKG